MGAVVSTLHYFTRDEQDGITAALAEDVVYMRVSVTLRDRNEDPIGSLTADPDWERAKARGVPGILGGQVDGDLSADTELQLSLTVLDPKAKLVLEKDHPGRGLFIDHFVSVTWDVVVDSDWVKLPVFWGPISHFERNGPEVSIEALGKESLGLGKNMLWRSMHIQKGTYVVDAIRTIMAQQGETRFDLPSTRSVSHRIHAKHGISLHRHAEPYKVAKRLANSINRQLFYDGAGRLRLRQWPEEPTLHVSDGWDDKWPGLLIDEPSVSYNFDNFANVVEVLGAKPERGIKRIRAVAHPKRGDPFSPWSMAHNGQPRNIVEVVETDIGPRVRTYRTGTHKPGDDKPYKEWKKAVWHSVVKRRHHAEDIAERRLREAMDSVRDLSANIIPQPYLELGDRWVVKTAELGRIESPLKRFTLPLTSDSGMSLNTTRQVRLRGRRVGSYAGGGDRRSPLPQGARRLHPHRAR